MLGGVQREYGGFCEVGGLVCLVRVGGNEGPGATRAHVLHHGQGLPERGHPSLGPENTSSPLPFY